MRYHITNLLFITRVFAMETDNESHFQDDDVSTICAPSSENSVSELSFSVSPYYVAHENDDTLFLNTLTEMSKKVHHSAKDELFLIPGHVSRIYTLLTVNHNFKRGLKVSSIVFTS